MVVVGEWVRLGAHIHCLVSSVHSRLPVVSMMFTVALPPACINISYVGLANDYQEHFSSFCDALRVASMVSGDIVHSTGKVVNVGR